MSLSSLDYNFQTRRLALGIEFEDYLRGGELVAPVRAEIEYQSPHVSSGSPRRYSFSQMGSLAPGGLQRSASGRYSLSYFTGIQTHVDLRILDDARTYVPRRLRVPLRTLTEVLDDEAAEVADYLQGRVRQVTLFAGAAYPCHSTASGLYGRVLRNGEPLRWAYVSARLPGGAPVAMARGDDRGEFLLVLPPEAAPASDLTTSLDIEISIAGPALVPVSPALAQQDEFWDLPLEQVPPAGVVDEVSSGAAVPEGYVTALSTVRTVPFVVGRLLTGRDEPDFNFVLP